MFENQEFSESSLSRCLLSDDFFSDSKLSDTKYRQELLKKSAVEADDLFILGIDIEYVENNKKKSYYLSNLSQRLILRKCLSNIKKTTSLRIKSRNKIAQELKVYLEEGTPYRIYRLDIDSFFESIDYETLSKKLNELSNLSIHTKRIILSLSYFFKNNIGCAVPRGIETSPILAELILSDFDNIVSRNKEVIYYSRFVDDIILVTTSHENKNNFLNELEGLLPGHLKFNKNKTQIACCKKRSKANSLTIKKLVLSFDYLGLSFKVYDSPLPPKKIQGGQEIENDSHASKQFREVEVDFSESKVKKIKSKVCKAFYAYSKDRDYFLLRDRIRFLTTNRSMINKNKGTIIPVGIYYNNSPVIFPSQSIKELDLFLKKMATSKKGRLCRLYGHFLTKKQKKELLQYDFEKGFNKRLHKRFSANRLADITRIWK